MEGVGRQEGGKKEKEVRQKKAEENKEEKQKRKEEVKDRNTNVTVDSSSSNDIPSNTDVMAVDPSFLSDRDSLALLETSLTMIILR